VLRVDNLTTFKRRLSRNLAASTSWNLQGLYRPVISLLYLYLYPKELRNFLASASEVPGEGSTDVEEAALQKFPYFRASELMR
jgi:hypothetical protein